MERLRAKLEKLDVVSRSNSEQASSQLLTPDEVEGEKESLFRKTSDAVKAVQRRFHQKQELATSADASVSCLCAQIEAVFMHGLKAPKKGGDHAFWPFVKEALDPTDISALSLLTRITTDSGKGRAWIRWALNERSLEKYLHKLISNTNNIKTYYEPHAYLADEDRVSTLAMLVVGLSSTVFAIELDDANLNTPREYEAPFGTQPRPSLSDAPLSAPSDVSQSVDDTPAAFVGFHEPMEIVKKTKKKVDKKGDRKTEKKKKKKLVAEPSISEANVSSSQASIASILSQPLHDASIDSIGHPASSNSLSSSYNDSTISPDYLGTRDSSQSADRPPSPVTIASMALEASRASVENGNSIDQEPSSIDTALTATNQDLDKVAPPSPATVARRALHASRQQSSAGSPIGSVAAPSMSNTNDGMTADELRQVLLGVMRSKDALEEEIRQLKRQQLEKQNEEPASDPAAVAQMERKNQSLMKENSLLKQQLKKYVAEAQMLKQRNRELENGKRSPGAERAASASAPDANGLANDNDSEDEDNNNDETFGGYASVEDMQAHHENQILQLTEMHCELMELNERYQEQIRTRDQIIKSMGGTVPKDSMGASQSKSVRSGTVVAKPARLPPPHPGIPIPGTTKPIINVWIPTALLRGKGADSHHVYQIYVRVGDDEWNVYRRFTHFHDLHKQVQNIFAGANLKFPKKKAMNRKNTKFVEERRQALELYLRQIIELCLSQHRSPLVQNPCKYSVCEALPFLKEKLANSQESSSRPSQGTYSGL
eukprot:m.79648 g.79648  ORF g.79648 m.79648 type:complete len:772 (+) comp12721_c0_seq2:142-2457(+)